MELKFRWPILLLEKKKISIVPHLYQSYNLVMRLLIYLNNILKSFANLPFRLKSVRSYQAAVARPTNL